MKRIAVSTLATLCGLLVTATAHASYVEKTFRDEPEWKTQEQVDAESDVRLDARTAVDAQEVPAILEEKAKRNFQKTDRGDAEFGERLTRITVPDSSLVSRAEFTAMLVRSKYTKASIDSCYWDITSVHPPRFNILFRDVPVGHKYAPEICVAMRDGLVHGYGNDIFRPEAPITFADAAKVVARSNGLTPWADPSKPKHWFDIYIQALARRNAIPMSIEKLEQHLTAGDAQEIIDRLASDDRSKSSRTADELIAAWEKTYERPRPAMVIRVPQKPTSNSSSSAGAKASAGLSSKAASVKSAASSNPPLVPTGSASSRPKAWYEF